MHRPSHHPTKSSILTRAQGVIVAIVFATLILDGLDVQLLSFVTPLILHEWHVDKATFAPALAAALIGMAVGTWSGGWMGDRWGRKSVLVGSALLFGVATMGAGLCGTVPAMSLLRLASGIGFGAAYPNGLALVTEWLPVERRVRVVGLLSVSAPLGGMAGALFALGLLAQLGWRGSFFACGALALFFAAVMVKWLPESPAFLVAQGQSERAARLLKRIAGPLEPSDVLAGQTSGGNSSAGRRSIFVRDLLRLNMGAALSFFAIAFVSYALSSWMPTVLTGAGLTVSDAILGSFFYNAMAIAGSLCVAWLMPRAGSRFLLLGSCGLSLALITVIGAILGTGLAADHSGLRWGLLIAIGLAGGSIGGAISSTYAILSFGYPADRRATGIGFGLMTGRVGGIVAVLAGGQLLNIVSRTAGPFFMVLFVATVVALIGAAVIDRHVRPVHASRNDRAGAGEVD